MNSEIVDWLLEQIAANEFPDRVAVLQEIVLMNDGMTVRQEVSSDLIFVHSDKQVEVQTSSGWTVERITLSEFTDKYMVPAPPNRTLRLLASLYDNRPGFKEEWKP